MKRRIYLAALFFMLLFLFDRGAALLFRELNYSFYKSVSMKRNTRGKNEIIPKDFYDTLVFGSSRTHSGIHPLYLNQHLGLKAYSAAKQGRYPEYYRFFYRDFRDNFGKPSYVICGVDYFMFGKTTSSVALAAVSKKKKPVRRINIDKMINKNSVIISHLSNVYRLKNKIDKTVEDVLLKWSIDWDKPDGKNVNTAGINTYTGEKTVIKPRVREGSDPPSRFPYLDSRHGEGKAFIRLLDELEHDGVTVFLVGIPDYIGTWEASARKDLFVSDIRGLIRGREGVWFLDYNSPEKFDLSNPRYFKDGGPHSGVSHLSYYGGIPFNRMLSADIGRLAGIGFRDPD